MEDKKIICCRCNKELKPEKTDFSYLGHVYHADIMRCPECGVVYIPEDLVKGRMCEVETMLEDK